MVWFGNEIWNIYYYVIYQYTVSKESSVFRKKYNFCSFKSMKNLKFNKLNSWATPKILKNDNWQKK